MATYFDILDLGGEGRLEPVLELLRLGIAQTARVTLDDRVVGVLLLAALLLDAGELFALELIELHHDHLVVGLEQEEDLVVLLLDRLEVRRVHGEFARRRREEVDLLLLRLHARYVAGE